MIVTKACCFFARFSCVFIVTILIALIIKSGFSDLSFRLLLILVFIIITNPVNNHIIARSAYLNGISIKEEAKK